MKLFHTLLPAIILLVFFTALPSKSAAQPATALGIRIT